MKTILIAGATGYLGRYLVIELLRRGCRVRAIVRNSSKLEINNTSGLEIHLRICP